MKKSLVACVAVSMFAGLMLSPAANAAVAPPPMTGFVIGDDGVLYTSSRRPSATGGPRLWDPPVPVSPQEFASPGGGVSAARFPDGNIAAFYIGLDGVLQASYTAQGQWQPPAPITVAGTYAPGAQVVTVKSPIGVDAVAVDRNNWIYVTRADFRLPPQRWMGIPAPTAVRVPSGAPLSAQRLSSSGELLISFVDSGGALTVLRLTSAGMWLPPTRLTSPGAAAPRSTVKMAVVGGLWTIFWIDVAGIIHKTTPTASGPPIDERLTRIAPLAVTAGLSAVPLPNGLIALFFADSTGAVDVFLTDSRGRQVGPFALTQAQIIPPGTKLEMALTADSSATSYDIDGDLCPPMKPWPWPGPWPPLGAWANLSVRISPSGVVTSSQLGQIGLTDSVVTSGNVAVAE